MTAIAARLTLALLAACLPRAAAAAPTFADAPISCGEGSHYASCSASFDGWALTIAFKGKDGAGIVARYSRCEASSLMIVCAAGEWRAGDQRGPLGPRTLGLRDGRPFAP